MRTSGSGAATALAVGVVVAVALGATGCARDDDATTTGTRLSAPADLLGDGVRLVSGTLDGEPLDVPDGARVTLVPGDGTDDLGAVSGTAGCNRYGGRMTVDDDRVAFGTEGVSMTEMACAPSLMELEAAYVAALPRVTTGRWDEQELTLSGDGVELVFAGLQVPGDSALVGTVWRLDSLLDGETASSTVAGAEEATLELREDGTLTGGTGCRSLTGRYELRADEVLLTDLTADGECPGGLTAQDEHVVEVLGDGFTATVEGPGLVLASTTGGRGLVYVAP